MSVCPSEGPPGKEVHGGHDPTGIIVIFEIPSSRAWGELWLEAQKPVFGKGFRVDIILSR